MEKKEFSILIMDDHPLITNAYERAFEAIHEKHGSNFRITVAHNFSSALHTLKTGSKIDLAILDIQLPVEDHVDIISGEDLGLMIRKDHPTTKIVISTTFNDHYRIHSIIESISPEGFMIKNDINPEEMVIALERLLWDPPYYSKTVVQSLRKYVTNDFLLDRIDRQLLYQISLGTTLHEIGNILSLSRAAISRRKQHLKEVLGAESGEDRELIQKAKEKGFI